MNSLVKKETALEVAKQIDSISNEFLSTVAGNMEKSFAMGFAIIELRRLLDQPQCKELIMSLKDTPLGFITDRSDSAIESSKKSGKALIPYDWFTIRENVIQALLKGYNVSGKEWMIIASNFYPLKDGKYRKIIEYPGLTDLKFAVTTPIFEEGGKLAKCRCTASWCINGERFELGGDNDVTAFRIRVNAGMGDDGIIGKAISKLFTRV
jgi:hypothetical protein